MSKYQFMIKFRKRLISYKTDIEPLNQEQKLAMIESDTFPMKQCIDCALTLRTSNPNRFAIVIGSLGFIQPDGSIFWEYG